ncbi:AraC family transcriptional regulator [Salmonella enterica subsp. enterica serovar Reading]|nr:AraC family transcriptional regulator [Salmonella enterica subsp. enterica serovar Reading]
MFYICLYGLIIMELNRNPLCTLIYIKKKHYLKINTTKIEVLEGDFIFIKSCENHKFVNDASKLLIHFPVDFLYDQLYKLGKENMTKNAGLRTGDFLSGRCLYPKVVDMLINIYDNSYDQKIKSAVINFFLASFDNTKHLFPFYLSFFGLKHRISILVKTDISRKWRLENISSLLCVGLSTLKKNLKKENTTFIKILTECRMEHAAKQLLISNKNITQISAECGYSSASYFITIFTIFFGVRPSSYARIKCEVSSM